MTILDTPVFTLAPIALWLEDFSEIKKQFELWRAQGIQDLRGYLLEDLSRDIECARKIKILSVNQKTLELYEAQDLQHLISNLEQIFKGEMASTHIDELISLWEGQTEFSSQAVNYSLNGKRLDIQLRGTVVPSHEHDLSLVLVSTENITPYTAARRQADQQRLLAESRFVYSPTSLWVEDFSRIKSRLDQLRHLGIDDFNTFLDVHPDFIQQCIRDVLIIDVNQATLDLFGAPDKNTLLQNIHKIFAGEM